MPEFLEKLSKRDYLNVVEDIDRSNLPVSVLNVLKEKNIDKNKISGEELLEILKENFGIVHIEKAKKNKTYSLEQLEKDGVKFIAKENFSTTASFLQSMSEGGDINIQYYLCEIDTLIKGFEMKKLRNGVYKKENLLGGTMGSPGSTAFFLYDREPQNVVDKTLSAFKALCEKVAGSRMLKE